MRRPTHPDAGMVHACPACGGTVMFWRQLTRDYRCNDCNAEFADPDERPDSRLLPTTRTLVTDGGDP